MENKKIAVSIVEAIVMILIITIGLVGVYGIYSRSMKMTINMGNKIEAIQIAREGIEAVTNIRDTNWLLFPSDKNNCWNTLNYAGSCICNATSDQNCEDYPTIKKGSYVVYRNDSGRWTLSGVLNELGESSINPLEYSNQDYREFFKVYADEEKGLYTHSGGITKSDKTITPLPQNFTREIIITPTEANALDTDKKDAIIVKSKVTWVDTASPNPQNVELEVVLTNYEKEKKEENN